MRNVREREKSRFSCRKPLDRPVASWVFITTLLVMKFYDTRAIHNFLLIRSFTANIVIVFTNNIFF